jgi:hypothetical protein
VGTGERVEGEEGERARILRGEIGREHMRRASCNNWLRFMPATGGSAGPCASFSSHLRFIIFPTMFPHPPCHPHSVQSLWGNYLSSGKVPLGQKSASHSVQSLWGNYLSSGKVPLGQKSAPHSVQSLWGNYLSSGKVPLGQKSAPTRTRGDRFDVELMQLHTVDSDLRRTGRHSLQGQPTELGSIAC